MSIKELTAEISFIIKPIDQHLLYMKGDMQRIEHLTIYSLVYLL